MFLAKEDLHSELLVGCGGYCAQLMIILYSGTKERKHCASGVEVPESLTKFSKKRGAAAHRRGKSKGSVAIDPVEMAREKFEIAAKAGCELGFKWLARLEEEERRVLTEGP